MLAKAYLRLSLFDFFDTTILNFTKIRSELLYAFVFEYLLIYWFA
uniref:Uncharacterized protein n=1 Tax=Arundo donax TaxID=35708 RepID=A0A0A9BSF8_ARUDO